MLYLVVMGFRFIVMYFFLWRCYFFVEVIMIVMVIFTMQSVIRVILIMAPITIKVHSIL